MSSFKSVLGQVKKIFAQEDVRVLSLDVFDTILHRSCPPQAVLDAVNRFVLSSAYASNLNITIDDVKNSRAEAYLRCANENVESGLDQETHVEDFIPLWMELLGLEEDVAAKLANDVIEHELYLERQVLFCDPGMVEIIKYAVEQGIRVVYCSDMYLPGSFVDSVLEEFGVLSFFSGRYISSEYKKLKRTKNLFDVMLSQECCAPQQMLHLGDNVTSDYVNARDKGIRSIWLNEKSQAFRRASLDYDYDHRGDESAQAYLSAELGSFYTEISSLPYSLGRKFFGPIYTSFIADVIDKAKAKNIDSVFFLAREGYALKRVYDNLAHGLECAVPPSVYIAGSRILSLLYSVNEGISLRHLADIFSNTSRFTISNILSPFSIPDEVLVKVCNKYGISSDQTLPPNFLEWPPFIRVSEDVELNRHIAEKAKEHRALYTEYLKKEGVIGANRIMVVDVGWGGQIQDNLYRGLQLAGHEPSYMTGCYLALNEKAHHRKMPRNWKEWSLADKGHLEWNGYSCFDTVFIYEAAVRAPHGTVLRLERNKSDGQVYPVLKADDNASRSVEISDDPNLAQLQKGIIDFSKAYALVNKIYPDFDYKSLRPYALSCMSAVNRFPSTTEYSWLASVGNVADLGSEYINVAGAEPAKKNIFSLKRAILSSAWREFVAYRSLGTIGVASLSILKYGRSVPRRFHPLLPGVPFLEQESVSTPSVDRNKTVLYSGMDPFLYRLADNNHCNMCRKGERKATLVSGRFQDKLTVKLVKSFLVYRAVNLSLRLRGRHQFYSEGLAFRYIVSRHAFSKSKYLFALLKRFGFKK